MANVLCQVKGTKRVILYPPSDISALSFPAGASSSTINVFENGPMLENTHPVEAVLKPGDVLFIPPLWLHTASPTETLSIAVNVFFRNLTKGYAAGRDVYGNRDLAAYENGRRDLDRLVKNFKDLPRDMARFYLERLADELKDKASTAGSS
jgi:tRNA wybutosine-synthesizing protein 4